MDVQRNLDASEVASLATDLNSMEVEYLRNLVNPFFSNSFLNLTP